MEASDQKQGLSTAHISTLSPARVSFYATGSLATATREQIEKQCTACGELFRVPAYRAYRFDKCSACREHKHTCSQCGALFYTTGQPAEYECPECGAEYSRKRGEVVEFSNNSRRRLMRALATVDKEIKPLFCTLTFSDAYEQWQDSEHWKLVLKRFELRFRRHFPDACYFWRLELVDRKSGVDIGQVKPHFHLLTFGVPYGELRRWLSLAWYESVGTGDIKHLHAGTQVKPILSRRGIMRYASKTLAVVSGELGKTRQAVVDGVKRIGRFWGIVSRENFARFQSVLESLELTEAESITLIRYFRRAAHLTGHAFDTLTTFFDGVFMSSNISRMLYPPARGKCYRATGRDYRIPFYEFQLGGNAGNIPVEA